MKFASAVLSPLRPAIAGLADRAGLANLTDQAVYARHAAAAGFLRPLPPQVLLTAARAARRYGAVGTVVSLGAARYGDRTAVLDDEGSVSFAELERLSNIYANAWRKAGLRPGQSVAILGRNSRHILATVFAAAKCGARIVLLNTDFAGPQVEGAAAREGAQVLVYDDEFADRVLNVPCAVGRWRATSGQDTGHGAGTGHGDDETLAALADSGASSDPPPAPGVLAKIVVLTSGTTGTPKGAPRSELNGLAPLGIPLSKVPFRMFDTVEMSAPLFHSLGFGMSLILLTLGNKLVLRRRFTPEATVRSIAEHRARSIVLVPVMLSRMLDAAEAGDATAQNPARLSSLDIVFVAGSQLGEELCSRAMRVLGPVVYNMYGSTEVAVATIATPADLTVAPSCVGRPVRGSVVRLLDDDGAEVPTGSTGRIFVGNAVQFEGYTTGEHKQQIGGLMSSGDVGHFDAHGRLFVDGRDDEMIVSGGENVFPREVEELLEGHPDVVEVAVCGVADDTFGQRLTAFVVRREGSELTAEHVQDLVRSQLARYKVPREVSFLDSLPRTATGKVLKRELVR